jgi:hypothetical protein
MGLNLGGLRPHRQIAYDDTFVMATLPTTVKGTAKVHPNQGVKIHSISYWADVFRDPAIEGSQVPVRYIRMMWAWPTPMSQAGGCAVSNTRLAGRSSAKLLWPVLNYAADSSSMPAATP